MVILKLNKSDYLDFLRHPAWLWLKKNEPEKIPHLDAVVKERMEAGYEFEEYVEQLFHGAIKIGFADFSEYRSTLRLTAEAWSQGAHCVIQGRYEAGEITCTTDVLEAVVDGYILTEIKSSASVKTEHEWDLAFQKVVLEAAGYKIRQCRVAHVDSSYVKSGKVKAKNLVAFTDITEKVEKRTEPTKANIEAALQILDSSKIPDIAPEVAGLNSFTEWLEVRKGLEPKLQADSIFYLPYLTASQAKKLKKSKIQSTCEITDASLLSGATAKYWNARSQSKRTVNKKSLAKFLTRLEYPVYYFDYETSQNVIPLWDATRPYQQVPFQYSLHVKRKHDSPVEHYEYLHQSSTNPIPELLASLKSHVDNIGSILVWYSTFETSRNKEMAEFSSEDADFLTDFNSRVVDLMVPFKEGIVDDSKFEGSASIKKVLPVMVPGFSHNDLNIKEGGSAARLWKEVVIKQNTDINAEQTFIDLKKYCERDTEAMVLIHQELTNLVQI